MIPIAVGKTSTYHKMSRTLDVEGWSRRQHFQFFKDFDYPFFNVCVNVDVTELHTLARSSPAHSFFVGLHYALARAANELECMRFRTSGDDVIVHDYVDIGTIVLRDDEAFAFCYLDYHAEYHLFSTNASGAIARAKVDDGALEPADWKSDIIHCTVLPWISFTSFAHARRINTQDSVPKIAAGKYFRSGDKILMPLSVEVHHGMMDGLHVGRYYEVLQRVLDSAAVWPE